MAKFVDFEIFTGNENMQKDLFLFERAVSQKEKEPTLRFYGWHPKCISLGRNQSEDTINIDFCRKNKIDVTKRITGGRALLHDDELTYSFVCPVEFLGSENIKKSYEIISKSLVYGFKKLGIDVDFAQGKPSTKYNYCMLLSTGADLCCNGKKIVGSAQYRANGYILQHGSVLFSIDENLIKNIFNESPKDKLITLNEIMPELNKKDLIHAFKNGFEQNFNIQFV